MPNLPPLDNWNENPTSYETGDVPVLPIEAWRTPFDKALRTGMIDIHSIEPVAVDQPVYEERDEQQEYKW